MPPNKRQIRERDGHIIVIVFSLALFLTPALLILSAIKPMDEGTIPNLGVIRDQPGQALVTQLEQAGSIENKALVAIERLNAGLTRIVLHEPLQQNLLGAKSGAEIRKYLLKLDPEDQVRMEKDLETAGRCGATWEPSIKPWGLYLLPTDHPPTNSNIPYGLVQLPYGAEKTLIETEKTLNQLNRNSKKTQLLSLLQDAVISKKITDDQALQIIAASQLLKISYRPGKKLFLSEKTLQNWGVIEATLKQSITPP